MRQCRLPKYLVDIDIVDKIIPLRLELFQIFCAFAIDAGRSEVPNCAPGAGAPLPLLVIIVFVL